MSDVTVGITPSSQSFSLYSTCFFGIEDQQYYLFFLAHLFFSYTFGIATVVVSVGGWKTIPPGSGSWGFLRDL